MNLKPSLKEIQKLAKDKHIENKKYFDKLKKKSTQESGLCDAGFTRCRVQTHGLPELRQLL